MALGRRVVLSEPGADRHLNEMGGLERPMARTRKNIRQTPTEEIDVREFRDIHIRFTGDVYVLAVWLAMSDAARSTPTRRPSTTLRGLAQSYVTLSAAAYFDSPNVDDVLAVFRRHGISGNPVLRLDGITDDVTSPSMLDVVPKAIGGGPESLEC